MIVVFWLLLLAVLAVPFAVGFAMLLALRVMQALVRMTDSRLPGHGRRVHAAR